MNVNIITFLFPIISIGLLLNLIVAKSIFNELKTLDRYFIVSKEGNFNKYYLYGIVYLFRIKETIECEKYIYYKLYLQDIYVKMSPIHKPIERIHEIKQEISLYERRIKLNKIKKRLKYDKLKIV